MTMSCDDTGTSGVRRFEVFTGAGRRRDWPDDAKLAIVAESYSGLESVSAVARRHALCPSQLFTWRRLLRAHLPSQGLAPPQTSAFAPAVISDDEPDRHLPTTRPARQPRRMDGFAIEVDIDGVVVRVSRDADVSLIAAVIEAVRATP